MKSILKTVLFLGITGLTFLGLGIKSIYDKKIVKIFIGTYLVLISTLFTLKLSIFLFKPVILSFMKYFSLIDFSDLDLTKIIICFLALIASVIISLRNK